MPRSVNTPQEQILHRKGTLFNFTHTLYQTRYDYFQDVAGLKSHAAHSLVNRFDDRRAGVVRVEGGTSGSSVFLRGQQFLQLGIFLAPAFLVGVKGIGKAAPAHIPRKDFLLFRRCLLGGFLQVFQQLDCLDIGLELSLGAAFAQVIVSDTEILGGATQIGLVFLIRGFLGSFDIGEGLPLAVYRMETGCSSSTSSRVFSGSTAGVGGSGSLVRRV